MPANNSSRFHTEYMPSNMHSSQISNWYPHSSSDTDSMASSNEWTNGIAYNSRQLYHYTNNNHRKRLLTPDAQLESPMLPSPSTRPPSEPNLSKNHKKTMVIH